MSLFLHSLTCSDDLKQVPDQLETLIGDKKFLEAATLLVQSNKNIHKAELANIGALSELKAYLGSQESVSMASIRKLTARHWPTSLSRSCRITFI